MIFYIKKKQEIWVNEYQPSVAFHIETSHLFRRVNQMSGFYIKRNTGLNWVNLKLPS